MYLYYFQSYWQKTSTLVESPSPYRVNELIRKSTKSWNRGYLFSVIKHEILKPVLYCCCCCCCYCYYYCYYFEFLITIFCCSPPYVRLRQQIEPARWCQLVYCLKKANTPSPGIAGISRGTSNPNILPKPQPNWAQSEDITPVSHSSKMTSKWEEPKHGQETATAPKSPVHQLPKHTPILFWWVYAQVCEVRSHH